MKENKIALIIQSLIIAVFLAVFVWKLGRQVHKSLQAPTPFIAPLFNTLSESSVEPPTSSSPLPAALGPLERQCQDGAMESCLKAAFLLKHAGLFHKAYPLFERICLEGVTETTACEELGHMTTGLQLIRFENPCSRKQPNTCKVAGLANHYAGRRDLAQRFLKRGCAGGDETACLFLGSMLTTAQIKHAQRHCRNNISIRECLLWVGAVMAQPTSHKELESALKQACHANPVSAMCTQYGFDASELELDLPQLQKQCDSHHIASCSILAGNDLKNNDFVRAQHLFQKNCKRGVAFACKMPGYLKR